MAERVVFSAFFLQNFTDMEHVRKIEKINTMSEMTPPATPHPLLYVNGDGWRWMEVDEDGWRGIEMDGGE